MKVFRNLFGNGSKIHADEIITGTPENHKTVKQSLDETAAHLAEIVHETIYLSEYKTNDYNMIFADITSRANANDFTTIVLDSRLVTLTIDLIFTKPVYVKGNKCRFATGVVVIILYLQKVLILKILIRMELVSHVMREI